MYHWHVPLSIVELIQRGTLDVATAARLWLAVERGASLAVAATPLQGAGKTTVLEALLAFVAPQRSVIELRGMYEDFRFLSLVPPEFAYLYCNEISDHLRRYMWGRPVAVLFQAVAAGYPLGTTMHAASAQEVLDTLAALGVPPEHLVHLNLILLLEVRRDPARPSRPLRHIVEVAEVRHDGESIRLVPVVRWQPADDSFRQLDAWRTLGGGDTATEVARREAALRDWVGGGLGDYAAVVAAIRQFQEGAATP